ncbi:MAG: protease pro-enzyme activation domain-containing protein [Candidatus Sulfotelmatobacter sp.]|jgi:hypothetical protein
MRNRLRSSSIVPLMATLTLFAANFVTVIAGLSASVLAQEAASGVTAAPHSLIVEAIDEAQLTVLKGNTPPLARPQFDLGTAPATLPMLRMQLVLKRSSDQEYALRKLLDDQQDKHSPSYHKWLTPTQFGQQFGPTDADIQTVTGWLQSHGFQVGTTKGRTVLEFSGSASQVQQVFHTAIHKYIVNGEQHWANSSDPSIPTALTPAVAGVLTLHNFLKKPQIHVVSQPAAAQLVKGKKPQVTFPAQNGQPITNALAPQDYAVIYNIGPTYTDNISGAGVTIGVVGRSNLFSSGEDVQDFQTIAFVLCCSVFEPNNIVLNGPDPGDLGGGEEAEATLDSTWSGAIAPNATVDLVVSASTNTSDGTDLSEIYIIENNLADIMTESFSSCEAFATDAQLAGTNALAQQAAAQGITYFVSTGDSGAEGCDDPSSPPASGPVSVNLLASTPFNVAVGGTMFNENGDTSKYWGSEPPVQESAISYIPEDVWNESSLTNGLWAGSGGASAGNIGSGGTTPGVTKPSWQSGVPGIPVDGVRDLPDVSLTAASHDPYLLCLDGSCVPDSTGEIFIYFVSGTSASAPSFAGIMALIDQQMGGRQGQANYVLYRLAASQTAYPAQCNASNTAAFPVSTCIFNDVTMGDNVVPGEVGTNYQATAGYDLTTGLGSVNVANLVSQWNTVTFNPTTTTLALNPAAIVHGSPVTATISVAPSSGTGTPTGLISLLAATGTGLTGTSSVANFTLANGAVSQSTSNLPGGGPYNVTANYAGDSTYAPSTSTPFQVIVTPESSTTALSVLGFTSSGSQFNFTSGPFGSFVYLRADIAGASGHGTPTGSVTFSDTFGAIPGGNIFTLNSGDQFQAGSNTATPNGVTFDTGTHTISASYSGDASFNASASAASQTFTITAGFFAVIPTAASTVIVSAPGGSGQSSISVSNSTGFTGTIILACSGLPTGAACQFSPATIAASGTIATNTSTITVTTTAATATLQPSLRPSLRHWVAVGGFMFFGVMLIGSRRQRRAQFLLGLVMLIIFIPACGGGGSHTTTTPPPPQVTPTPAGTYNVTVNATSGASTSSSGFVLVVQ